MITIVIKMGNKQVFKALSSTTRINILKLLINNEIHLTELAKQIGISKPVTSRHIKILEEVGLIKKRIVGNVHLLSSNIECIEEVFEPFKEETSLQIKQNDSLFDALKQIPGIEIQKIGTTQYITSINGEKGFYIYEVDGKSPQKPIDQYCPKGDVKLSVKKLVPIEKKKIAIRITDTGK